MGECPPEDYPEPVARAWRLSLERVEAEWPAAACLLRLCAFLAPDDIPIDMLTKGADALSGDLRSALTDDIQLDRTVAALRRYSLVERRDDQLGVHRLVQAVVREAIAADERDRWLATAVSLLRATFPEEAEEHPETWSWCARLIAHVQAVADLVADRPVEPRALSWLVNRAGIYLWARGQAGPARLLVQRATGIRERYLGPEDLDTAE